MAERANDDSQEQGTAWKRRGILAAAGVAVAGIVAKQTAQPVAAASVTLGGPNTELTTTTFYLPGPTAATLPAINGYADQGIGVQGTAFNSYGLYSVVPSASGASNTVGVVGLNQATGTGNFGVQGQSDGASGIGVIGASSAGVGVKGATFTGFPIIGQVVTTTNTAAGVLGSGTAGLGVQGQSTTGHGLVGTTDATDGHAGLIGNANHTGGVGLQGIAPNYGTISVGRATPTAM